MTGSKYPLDRHGRPIPDGSWPPGKEAPGRLEELRRFLNTRNLENGAERLDDPSGLDEWLVAEGRPPVTTDADGLATVLALRAALGDLAVANHDGTEDADAWDRLAQLAAGAPLVLTVVGNRPVLIPVRTGVAGLVGDLVAIVAEAWSEGSWSRLKACLHCRWVFWDHTRSRTGVWCSMSACGQREKQRRYRRRQGDAVILPKHLTS